MNFDGLITLGFSHVYVELTNHKISLWSLHCILGAFQLICKFLPAHKKKTSEQNRCEEITSHLQALQCSTVVERSLCQ